MPRSYFMCEVIHQPERRPVEGDDLNVDGVCYDVLAVVAETAEGRTVVRVSGDGPSFDIVAREGAAPWHPAERVA